MPVDKKHDFDELLQRLEVAEKRLALEEKVSFRTPLLEMQKIRDELAARVDRVQVALDALHQVAYDLTVDVGVEHDDPGCPEDDTCRCANVARVNEAFRLYNAACRNLGG